MYNVQMRGVSNLKGFCNMENTICNMELSVQFGGVYKLRGSTVQRIIVRLLTHILYTHTVYLWVSSEYIVRTTNKKAYTRVVYDMLISTARLKCRSVRSEQQFDIWLDCSLLFVLLLRVRLKFIYVVWFSKKLYMILLYIL